MKMRLTGSFRPGAPRPGAFTACRSREIVLRRDTDLMLSRALRQHLSTPSPLVQYAGGISMRHLLTVRGGVLAQRERRRNPG